MVGGNATMLRDDQYSAQRAEPRQGDPAQAASMSRGSPGTVAVAIEDRESLTVGNPHLRRRCYSIAKGSA
jgi:hypothetical protein